MRKTPHQTGTPRGATLTQILGAGAELPWPGEQHSGSTETHTKALHVCVSNARAPSCTDMCQHMPWAAPRNEVKQKAALTHIRHMWGSTAVLSQAQNTTAQTMGADAPAKLPTPDLCSFFQNHNLFLYNSAERSLSCSRNHKLLLAARAEHEVHCGKRSKSLTSAVTDFSFAALVQQLKLSITYRRPCKVSGGLFPTCSYRDPIL